MYSFYNILAHIMMNYLTLFSFVTSLLLCSSIQVNIVTISVSSNAGSGVEPMQSAFAIAVEDMVKKYPRVYRNYTKTDLTIRNNVCKDYEWMFPPNISQWYGEGCFNRPGLTIILASVCNNVASYVGDLAREMDITAVACATGFPTNPRYSTVVSMTPGSLLDYATALVRLMRENKWTYISLIHDNLTGVLEAGRPASITKMTTEIFTANVKFVNCKYFTADSVAGNTSDLRDVLIQASRHSRLIILSTLVAPLRKFLAAVYDLNMTNGDYVFLYIYSWQVPEEPPPYWKANDDLDLKVLKTLECVIVIASPLSDWPKWEATGIRVNKFRERIFGTAFEYERIHNDFAITCYGAAELISQVWWSHSSALINKPMQWNRQEQTLLVNGHLVVNCHLVAQVLDEILTEDNLSDSAITYEEEKFRSSRIIKRISHRVNQLTFENVSFAPGTGWRIPDIIIRQFNTTTTTFIDVYWYETHHAEFHYAPGRTGGLVWPSGIPPSDRPVCGFDGEKCTRSNNVIIVSAAGTGTLVAIVIASMIGYIWCQKGRAEEDLTWWVVDDLRQSVCNVSQKNLNESIKTTRLPQRVLLKDGRFAFEQPLEWNIRMKIVITKKLIKQLSHIHKFHHPNVNTLFGLGFAMKFPRTYYEWCPKGSVYKLIKTLHVDHVLKLGLLEGLSQGLTFIHYSPVICHGNLKICKCVIDARFTLKLTDYGHEKLCSLLVNKGLKYPMKTSFFPYHAWMAPEVRNGQLPTQESDVYSFAVILHQILMECEPFGVDLPEKLISKRTENLSGLFLSTITNLIRQAWNPDPKFRPKLRKFDRAIEEANIMAGLRGTAVERIIIQLEKYSAKLEHDVTERTSQLKSEQEIADQLLREMLPKEVVKKLRNGLPVVPEYVESISIYFNDIFGFADFVDTAAPKNVVSFLHSTYSAFDRAIAAFSVHKLETIGSSYVATSGLVDRIGSAHAQQICLTALAIQEAFNNLPNRREMALISGIHSGPVAVGVVGFKRPRYCVFGDTVNTASRMESHSIPNKIHVSPDTVHLASAFGFLFESRGTINVKKYGE